MTTLEQFISICYSLLQATQPTPQPLPLPLTEVEDLKEAMKGFERMMSLGTPDMPTKDDLALE